MRLGLSISIGTGGLADLGPLGIEGTPVTTADENVAYTGFAVTVTGGRGGRTVSLEGSWPPGLFIEQPGVVAGTPTVAGAYTDLTVRVTDSIGAFAELTPFTLTVAIPAPTFSVQPAITGTALEGATLTCSSGTAGPSVTSYTYQWKRGGVNISGAINATYVPVIADIGAVLTCAVTATNATGSVTATSAGTAAIVAATPDPPAISVAPAVTGTAFVGETLTTTNGTWTGSPSSYTYQWRRAGVNISGATASTHVLVIADAGESITCQVTAINSGGGTPAVSNATVVEDVQPLTIVSDTGGRPIGLGYNPTYAGDAYDPAADPPPDALRLSDYASFAAAVTACRAAGRAMLVDQDKTLGASDLGQSNVALWGALVSGRLPKLTLSGVSFSSSTKCLMYGVDGNVFARGIEFITFATVFGIAIGSINTPTYPYHTGSSYGFPRAVPFGMDIPSTTTNGIGVAWGGTKALAVMADVTFDIRDCAFTNCESVAMAVSDSNYLSPVHFHRNVLDGTRGGVDIQTTVCCDAYVSGNEWKSCTVANGRVQVSNSSHGQHTFFKMSVEYPFHAKLNRETIYIENNYAHDIYDQGDGANGTNSAVFSDLRNVWPVSYGVHTGYADRYTAEPSIRVRFNHGENLVGLDGNEDCNFFYGKVRGLLFEMNTIINCGAPDRREIDPTRNRNGSECTGFLIKETDQSEPSADGCVIVRYNTFQDMPTPKITTQAVAPATNHGAHDGLFVVKCDNQKLPIYFIGNHFVRCGGTATGNLGILRPVGDVGTTGAYICEDNVFIDCAASGGVKLIRYHDVTIPASPPSYIRNNKGFDGPSVVYSAPVSLVTNNDGSVTTTGNTVTTLDVGVPEGAATWSMTGSAGASARLAVPDLPEAGGQTITQVEYDTAPLYVSAGAIA